MNFHQQHSEANHSSTLVPTDETVFIATHYALAGCYFLLTSFTIALVVTKSCRGTLREGWKIAFFVFVILGSTLRGCWALFDPLMLQGSMHISNRTDLFLDFCPSVLFFSCYVVLLFLWVELYHYPARGSGMRIHRLRVHLLIVLALMFGVFGVLFILDAVLYSSPSVPISGPANIVERILILYTAAIYVICCVAFSVYGLLVLVPLWRSQGGLGFSPKRRDMLLRLLGLTMLIMCIFALRAAMVFIGFFANWSFVSYFDLLYYLTCEICPILIMFFILLFRGTSSSGGGIAGTPSSGIDTSINRVVHTGSFSDEKSPLVNRTI